VEKVGEQRKKKESFQQYFTTDTKSFIHVTRIAAMHIIFTYIGCTLFTCDMYMCRLRHINDSVLSSLKMEGIRLLFLSSYFCKFLCCIKLKCVFGMKFLTLETKQFKRKEGNETFIIV
jgi:hypothetical protein